MIGILNFSSSELLMSTEVDFDLRFPKTDAFDFPDTDVFDGLELEALQSNVSSRPLDELNIDREIDEYLDESASAETKKSTKNSVNLYNEVMKSYHEKTGTLFKPLDTLNIDEMCVELVRFFMVVKKNGKLFNGSSLITIYNGLARFISSTNCSVPTDIKKHVQFKKLRDVVKLRCTEAAKQGRDQV